MICEGCRYFLDQKEGYCGIGKDCITIIKDNECSGKVEGEVDFTLERCGEYIFTYPNKGIEQVPTSFNKYVKENYFYVHYYKRTNKRVNKLREVNITTILIVFPNKKKRLLYKKHIRNVVVGNRDVSCFDTDYKSDYNTVKLEIKWFESIRESYLSKQNKKHRHTIY